MVINCEECINWGNAENCPKGCDPDLHKELNPELNIKGKFNGVCNRSSCLDDYDVTWFNHRTRKFYCRSCAMLLNKENEVDSMRLLGKDLCEKISICSTCKGTGESPHSGGPCCMCDGKGYNVDPDDLGHKLYVHGK